MRGRPDLYTRYRDEMAMLKNPTQKFFALLLILGLLILGYIADDYWILLLTAAVFILLQHGALILYQEWQARLV